MRKALEKKLRVVRVRCAVNLLIEYAGRVLFVAGGVAVAAILVERLLALDIIFDWTIWAFCSTAVIVTTILWLLNLPSRMKVSLLLDERLKLKERFSSAIALDDLHDPFALAVKAQTRQIAEHLRPQAYFPVRPSKRWLYTTGIWMAVTALSVLVPEKDLLGLLRKRQEQQERMAQAQAAMADVNNITSVVKSVLKQLDNPELDDALAALDQIPKNAKPEDIKRQSIKKLGDLSDKLKMMQTSTKFESMHLLQQMLKRLPGSVDAFSRKLRLALAQGNFAEASALLKQLQKDLAEGKISKQRQEELSKKLEELAKLLRQLAEKNKELEKELERLGLDKKLAKLSPEQLRKALQRQGLSQDKIEQLLQKAAACRLASSRCSGLGQAMAACSVGSGLLGADQLGEVVDQLDELETLKQQTLLAQAILDQICGACQRLGRGMCQGLGAEGPYSKGYGKCFGSRTGGPGQGFGPRGYDDSGQTATKQTKVPNKPGEGPIIASWYFKGSQIKGEAKRDFKQVVEAARDGAAEAIAENEIPRKYQEAVKSYFSQLEESTGQ